MAKYPFKNCDSMANTQYENTHMFKNSGRLGFETNCDFYTEGGYLNNKSTELDSHWALHTDNSFITFS